MKKLILTAMAICFSGLICCAPPGAGAAGLRPVPRYSSARGSGIQKTALSYLGTPYVLGGASPRGFDCSGFVSYVYKQNGLSLPRTVSEQYSRSHKLQSWRQANPGDLVFFQTLGARYSHVGIYIGDGQFIHAPRPGAVVRIDSMSNRYWSSVFTGCGTYLN